MYHLTDMLMSSEINIVQTSIKPTHPDSTYRTMSDKTARTHTQLSNRAKPKDSNDKKVVFKSVLDNPYRIRW